MANIGLKKALSYFNGNQSALARAVGVSPQAVQQWVTSGVVPPKRARKIESVTKRSVKRQELNQDVFGDSPQ